MGNPNKPTNAPDKTPKTTSRTTTAEKVARNMDMADKSTARINLEEIKGKINTC